MGESLAGDPGLQPPEGQAGPGEEGTEAPLPPAPPVEGGQGDAGQGEGVEPVVAEPEWSADRKKGYTEGTSKYADDLRERDLTIQRLQIDAEVARRATAPPAEQFPETVDRELFTAAQKASPGFQSVMEKLSTLEGAVSESTIGNTLARLEKDHGKRPYFGDVAEKVRAALHGAADLRPATVEAAFNHLAAPKRDELVSQLEAEVRALKKGQKTAIVRDGFSAPGGRAAGGEGPKAVEDMTDEELANARLQYMMSEVGA